LKKITKLKPFLFEDWLIISFSKDWINFFSKIPTFDVGYENGKLVIQTESKKVKDD